MRATIICPTFNHGRWIEHPVASVLAQTHQDFELFIIGDGVPDEQKPAVESVAAKDPRITFIDRKKTIRHGEEYRHEVLSERASGEFVFYISDDDLWLPNHLESLIELMETHDLVHCRNCKVMLDSSLLFMDVNWSDPNWRSWTIDCVGLNEVCLSQGAHRMDFYRSLPSGWQTTPKDQSTDHYMWKKMLSAPGVRAAGSGLSTALKFPTWPRINASVSEQDRYNELAAWARSIVTDPKSLEKYITFCSVVADRAKMKPFKKSKVEPPHINLHMTIKVLNETLEKNRTLISSLKAELNAERDALKQEKIRQAKNIKAQEKSFPKWYLWLGRKLRKS